MAEIGAHPSPDFKSNVARRRFGIACRQFFVDFNGPFAAICTFIAKNVLRLEPFNQRR